MDSAAASRNNGDDDDDDKSDSDAEDMAAGDKKRLVGLIASARGKIKVCADTHTQTLFFLLNDYLMFQSFYSNEHFPSSSAFIRKNM